ncbi:MAG: 50S ribosomal protein L10 [Candidatus Hadarchaeota archaeon]
MVSKVEVAPWKQEVVGELGRLAQEYPVIGLVDISELPAKQFQQIRRKLRGQAVIIVSKNTLLTRALDKAAEKDAKFKELAGMIGGQSGLIFSKMNPFKLNKFLRDSRVNAPAKPGSKSQKDVIIPAGDTDLAPGPAVGELQKLGIKARIQAGKVVILEDFHILKVGDVVTKEISDAIAKFGIMPLELGIRLKAAFEGGTIFVGSVLDVDEKVVISQLLESRAFAFSLAMNASYPARETISILLVKSKTSAMNLALNSSLTVGPVMPVLLVKAKGQMLALAAVIGAKNPSALDDELKAMVVPS